MSLDVPPLPGNQGRVRMVTIGAGQWGERHASVLASLAGVDWRGACDTEKMRSESLSARYGGRAYGSLEEVIQDGSIDAVTVALPDHLHGEAVTACASAGKHVYVEKPFSTSLVECDTMIAAVAAADVRLMVGFASRFSMPLVKAWEAVRANGEPVRHVRIVQRNTLAVPTDLIPWAAESNILWWLGSHSIDTARWLINSPIQAVSAHAGRGRLEKLGVDTPDFFITILRFRSGATAVLENGWILPNSFPGLVDWRIEAFTDSLAVSMNPNHHRAVEVTGAERVERPDVFYDFTIEGAPRGALTDALGHFVACVATNREPRIRGYDGRAVTAAILAALESASSDGAWTPVEDLSEATVVKSEGRPSTDAVGDRLARQ